MDSRIGRVRRPCERDGTGTRDLDVAEPTAGFVHVAHATSLPGALRAAPASRCAVRRPRSRPIVRRCIVARVGSSIAGDDTDRTGAGGGGGDFLGDWMPASVPVWHGDEEAGGGEGPDATKPAVAMVGGGDLEFADQNDEFADDDEDLDDDDDEDKEVEEEEDEDLASYEIETDDDDDEVSVPAARGVRGKASLGLGGVDGDEEDDVDDFEEGHGDLLDVSSPASALEGDDEVSAITGGSSSLAGGDVDLDVGDDLDGDLDPSDELFDEESEAELLSAAKTLKGSGLLGLGVDGASRSTSSELASFLSEDEEDTAESATPRSKSTGSSVRSKGPQPSPALADLPELVRNSEVVPIPLEDDDDDSEGTPGLMNVSNDEFDDAPSPDEDPLLAGPKNLDAYTDDDEHDDEVVEFGVTTATSFGRIWELNDDAFVTITEPGEAYAYDIDEADQEDQDSAVLRRGKAGGWGGGLASDSRSNLQTGSKEWVARRAYDLVTKSSAAEMFKWTRARKSPPDEISSLFPPEPDAAPKFGATALNIDSIGLDTENDDEWLDGNGDDDTLSREMDSAAVSSPDSLGDGAAVAVGQDNDSEDPGLDAIERSVDFPCMYKFKVVGSGEGFVESLTVDMEVVLGREVPRSAFEFEPAGRYQRITINVEVDSARQVTELYEAIRMATGVKFSYG